MGIIKAGDGVLIRHTHWDARPAKAAMLIIHGMAEHMSRYSDFAEYMSQNGVSVMAIELRGHGEGAEKLGWFAEKDGEKAVVSDLLSALDHLSRKNPGVPLFLLGHSMGTVFARMIIMDKNAPKLAACVLSGVTVDQPVRRNFAPLITRLVGLFSGKDKPSKLLADMTFGSFNKAFQPNRTEHDWLSRDEAQVDKYVADPFCGFDCTPSLLNDVSRSILFTLKKKNEANISCPVLICVGSGDPVGGGKAAIFLQTRWKALGKDVSVIIYENARHEILNETNRDEVFADILEYIRAFL